MAETVRIEDTGPIRELVLDEPRRANPLTEGTIGALRNALEVAAVDDGVRAVLIRAEGKHFSAGIDLETLKRLGDRSPEENLADSRHFEELFRTLLPHPKLTVAAVQGAAVGGGCGLASACDLVVAADDARFQYTEVKIGFMPALVSTFLVRRVPGHVARRLLLDPEFLSAEEARAVGLADELVPRDSVIDHARERALAICRKSPPSALAATKRLLFETPGMGLDDALRTAAEVNARQRTTADCQHGVRTFLESKTTPDWLESPG